mmetsp:Transcript_5622/g.13026  ORF Transcript_5622/g.13026 Transcript_5622/m.13026 type:complete len:538 (+) Transcript_5622:318-1931(+)
MAGSASTLWVNNATRTNSNKVLSFFQLLLRKRFEGTTAPEAASTSFTTTATSTFSTVSEDDDNDILDITFESIDDVIDFYKSDDEEDDEDEHDYGNRDQSLPTRTKLFEDYNNHNDEGDDDAIVVSSWIDNYHYLLVEQEKRQKKIQFFVDDDQDDNDNNNNNIHSSDEEEESSSCGSCCSLDTTSTWQSMDTNEAEKFRDFLDECIANQGIHGKNTKNSILARMIREVLVGPCDDDFEIDGDFDSDCDYSNDNDNDNEGDENNHDNESDNDNDNDDNINGNGNNDSNYDSKPSNNSRLWKKTPQSTNTNAEAEVAGEGSLESSPSAEDAEMIDLTEQLGSSSIMSSTSENGRADSDRHSGSSSKVNKIDSLVTVVRAMRNHRTHSGVQERSVVLLLAMVLDRSATVASSASSSRGSSSSASASSYLIQRLQEVYDGQRDPQDPSSLLSFLQSAIVTPRGTERLKKLIQVMEEYTRKTKRASIYSPFGTTTTNNNSNQRHAANNGGHGSSNGLVGTFLARRWNQLAVGRGSGNSSSG